MSFIDSNVEITRESVKTPYFLIIYGRGGVGKSQLCSHSNKPFYLALEHGVNDIAGVGSFKYENPHTGNIEIKLPKNADEFFEAARWLITEKHDYKTIVIDSGKFLDVLFEQDVLKKNQIEVIKNKETKMTCLGDYNYSRGYEMAMQLWKKTLVAIDAMKSRGYNVILICHSAKINDENINGDTFKKIGIDLMRFGAQSAPLLTFDKCHACYYMRFEIETREVKGKIRASAHGQPDIVLYTRGQNGFDAKVRTKNKDNIPDHYIIDWDDPATSTIIFEDLEK